MTSATEVLRRALDEHDEYYKTSGNKTWWGRPIDRQTGKPINVFHYQAQPMGEDRLFVELQLATPEQAIAATLGPAYEPPVAMHWNGDVLTLTIPRDPSCIRVQRSAEQPCKVYADESKVIAATLGATDAKPTQVESSGTCQADETDTWECVRDDLGGYGKRLTVHVMECTECGHTYEHVNGDYEYCPRCGRKRRDVEE